MLYKTLRKKRKPEEGKMQIVKLVACFLGNEKELNS